MVLRLILRAEADAGVSEELLWHRGCNAHKFTRAFSYQVLALSTCRGAECGLIYLTRINKGNTNAQSHLTVTTLYEAGGTSAS